MFTSMLATVRIGPIGAVFPCQTFGSCLSYQHHVVRVGMLSPAVSCEGVNKHVHFCPAGGELFALLEREGVFLEDAAR